jgi:hypothetical protein
VRKDKDHVKFLQVVVKWIVFVKVEEFEFPMKQIVIDGLNGVATLFRVGLKDVHQFVM